MVIARAYGRAMVEKLLVDRDQIRPFDSPAEGEFIHIVRRDGAGLPLFVQVAPLRLRAEPTEGLPKRCAMLAEWGESHRVEADDLPPKVARGMVPPVDCPFDDCLRCWE